MFILNDKSIVLIMFVLLLASCVSLPTDYPKLEENESRIVFIVGASDKGRYLNQFPHCERENVICMDPPPVLLRTKVLDTFDDNLKGTLFVATTNHFGTMDYEFSEGLPFLMKLKTDGKSNILLRYQREEAFLDNSGNYMIPLLAKEKIDILPCKLNELKEPVDYSLFDLDDFITIEDFNEFNENGEYKEGVDFRVIKGRALAIEGIYFHKIRDLISKHPEIDLSEECNE